MSPLTGAATEYGYLHDVRASSAGSDVDAVTGATRTNLAPNPSFETNTTGWVANGTNTIGRATATFVPGAGTACLALTKTGTTGTLGAETTPTTLIPVTAGLTYTGQCQARAQSTSRTLRVTLRFYNSTGTLVGTAVGADTTDTTDWGLWSATGVAPDTAVSCVLAVGLATGTPPAGEIHYVDAVLVEASTGPGVWFDGNTVDTDVTTYAWNGTVNNSTSVAAGVAAVPAGATSLPVGDAADFDEAGGTILVTSLNDLGQLEGVEYQYETADVDNDLLTLASPLLYAAADADRVDVWPPAPEKQAVVVIEGTGEAVSALVPHDLLDLVGDGIRAPDEQEAVGVGLVGDQWMLTEVAGQGSVLSSPNYVEGESGWLLDADTYQIPDANVLGELGADVVSANTLTVGEVDLADLLAALPRGVIAYGAVGAGQSTAQVTAETIAFTWTFGPVDPDRQYRVTYRGHWTTALTANSTYKIRVRRTSDGTTPTTSSPVVDHSITEWSTPNGTQHLPFEHTFLWSPGTAGDVEKFAVTIARAAGTGYAQVYCDDANYGFQIWVEDLGLAATNLGLAQKSKTSADPPDPDTGNTYTKTWTANASASYDADNGKRLGEANTPNCYQGFYSSLHGNTKSIVCFNDSDIRAKLAGATVTKVKLTFRVRHAYYNAGLDVRIRNHNYTNPPTTFSGAGMSLIYSRNDSKEGGTYTVTLPASFGTDLKNGNARGIGFYGPSTDKRYYGYMYGPGSGSAPRLTITYTT